jgi:hypothetical protein
MQMQLPQRLSITGMGGLAALSATHWMRGNILDPSPVLAFVLGVLPNLAAAFSMPLILASLVPLSSHTPDTVKFRRMYLWILVFTAAGLCSWEFIQMRSNRFVFDTNDLVATGFGSILAYLAFRWHVSGSRVSTRDSADRDEA